MLVLKLLAALEILLMASLIKLTWDVSTPGIAGAILGAENPELLGATGLGAAILPWLAIGAGR